MLKDIIGRNITAMVTDENDRFIFAQKDGMTFRLDKSELIRLPKAGAMITGFAYENENHQLQLTKNPPKCGFDRYAWGTVMGVQRDLGVFVDVGLKNKDIAVSLDELPELPGLWPKKGDRLMIALRVDDKGRLWGTPATTEMFQAVSVKADARMRNRNVEATAYRLKMAGTYAITSDYCLGFIHPTEREREPRLGEVLKARQLHLQAALLRPGPLGEDVEDQARAVEHAHAEFLLQHAHLRRGELIVKHREIAVVHIYKRLELGDLAVSDEAARIRRRAVLYHHADRLAAGRLDQCGKLLHRNLV